MEKCCTFIGHRDASLTLKQYNYLYQTINTMILLDKLNVFLIGSKGKFNQTCKQIIKKLKEKYPFIKIIYVRAEYQYISEDYYKYLLNFYDESIFPKWLKVLIKILI